MGRSSLKEDIIAYTVKKITDQFGEQAASTAGIFSKKIRKYVSTNNLALDWAMGTPGGLPFGRIVEIRGKTGSCKSTTCAEILGQTQLMGGLGVLCDSEFTYTGEWLAKHSCNIDDLIQLVPDHAQMFFDQVCLCINTVKEAKPHTPIVIVCDTISNLPAYEEWKREDSTEGIQASPLAKAISTGLRKLSNLIFMQDVTLIFVSQLKDNPRASFGDKESVIGGGAIPLLSSIRIKLARLANLKIGDGPVFGQKTQIQITKNKLAMPWRVMTFDLDYVKGIDNYAIALEFLIQLGDIKRAGAYYHFSGERFEGKQGIIDHLRESGPSILMDLRDRLGISPTSTQLNPMFVEQGPAMITNPGNEIEEAEIIPDMDLTEE